MRDRAGSETLDPSSAQTRPGHFARASLLALAALFALSPVLLDLLRHLGEEGWARTTLLVALPLVWAVAESPRPRPAPGVGAALVAGGLAVEILAVGGGYPRFGRPALPLLIAGILTSCGIAPLRVAVLAIWLVPPPRFLLGLTSPQLETFWLGLAAAPWESARVAGPAVSAGHGVLALQDVHGGPFAGLLLSAAGWFLALRRGCGVSGCAARAAVGFALGLPLQGIAIFLAVALLAAGSARAAAGVAGPVFWTACAIAGPATALLVRRREPV